MNSQPASDGAMDAHNNAIVSRERPRLRTWADTVKWARAKMDAALLRNGDGANGTPMWYRKAARAPARPDWEALGIPEIEERTQEKGSEAQPGDPQKPGAALERDPTTWTQQDVDEVIGSAAYRQRNHPDRELAHAAVRAWFERQVAEQPGTASPSQRTGEVRVRAHARDGGKVQVRAHARAAPA